MENNMDGQRQTQQIEPMEPVTPMTPTPQPKHTGKKTWIVWLLVILVLVLLGGAGYLWWQLQGLQDSNKTLKNDRQYLQSQIEKLNNENMQSEEADVVCTDMPTTIFKDNIKAALDTKNTAAFAMYTSNPVQYVLAASEEGGDKTPDQAAQSLAYTHSATGPWDFNLPAVTIAGYDASFYTNYFDANTYAGRAASGMVVAFDFDCDGKISKIFVAADEDLLL